MFRNEVRLASNGNGSKLVLSFTSPNRLQPHQIDREARSILGNDWVKECWHNLCFSCEKEMRKEGYSKWRK